MGLQAQMMALVNTALEMDFRGQKLAEQMYQLIIIAFSVRFCCCFAYGSPPSVTGFRSGAAVRFLLPCPRYISPSPSPPPPLFIHPGCRLFCRSCTGHLYANISDMARRLRGCELVVLIWLAVAAAASGSMAVIYS